MPPIRVQEASIKVSFFFLRLKSERPIRQMRPLHSIARQKAIPPHNRYSPSYWGIILLSLPSGFPA